MRLLVNRYGIEIIPENPEDGAYIEDTLGLKTEGDSIPLIRRNVYGLSCIAYLETKKKE